MAPSPNSYTHTEHRRTLQVPVLSQGKRLRIIEIYPDVMLTGTAYVYNGEGVLVAPSDEAHCKRGQNLDPCDAQKHYCNVSLSVNLQ